MRTLHGGILVAVFLSITGCGDSPTTPTPPTVYEAGTSGVSLPVVIRQVQPNYTAAAIAARIQGSVLMTAVVLTDGTVGEVIVTRSLDTVYGLDAEAVRAAKQWLFTPGMKDGRPVAVRVTIEMTFTLR